MSTLQEWCGDIFCCHKSSYRVIYTRTIYVLPRLFMSVNGPGRPFMLSYVGGPRDHLYLVTGAFLFSGLSVGTIMYAR